jgi:hypothetical protein
MNEWLLWKLTRIAERNREPLQPTVQEERGSPRVGRAGTERERIGGATAQQS